MKVTFRQLSKRGDDVTIVDTDKVATNDPAALAAIKAAREIFAEVAARSGSAYGISAERGTVRHGVPKRVGVRYCDLDSKSRRGLARAFEFMNPHVVYRMWVLFAKGGPFNANYDSPSSDRRSLPYVHACGTFYKHLRSDARVL